MPAIDSRTPADNRASRTVRLTVGRVTANPGTNLFSLNEGDLDLLQSGDLVRIVDVAGGAGVIEGAPYFLRIASPTSFGLTMETGEWVHVTGDVLSGTLTYGDLDPADGIQQSNYVPMHSVAGGAPGHSA